MARSQFKANRGAGSTFTITLPLKIANEEERNPETCRRSVEYQKLEGKRVLLVEDNDLNAEIATELLTEEGIMIERAENGVACIDMFNKSKAKLLQFDSDGYSDADYERI